MPIISTIMLTSSMVPSIWDVNVSNGSDIFAKPRYLGPLCYILWHPSSAGFKG